MSWYAVDAIDEALDTSREFLLPFSLARWVRLAMITLFVGGASTGGTNLLTSPPSLPSDTPSGPAEPAPTPTPADVLPLLTGSEWGLALLVGAIVVGVLLVLWLLSATFEFVFVDAIRRDHVRILRPFVRRLGDGLRLLAFDLVVGLVTVAPFAVAGYLLYVAGGSPGFDGVGAVGDDLAALGVAGVVAVGLLSLLWFALWGLVAGLTRTFVVPVMVATDAGVVDGWRRLWPRLCGEWKQTLVYLLVRFFVGLGVGLVAFVLQALGGIVVGILALVVGLVAAAATHGGNPLLGGGVGLLAAAAVGVPLFLLLVALPVGVLTATYLRTYELASLAGFDPAFDLLEAYEGGPGSGTHDAGGARGDGPDGDGGRTAGGVGDAGAGGPRTARRDGLSAR